MRIPLVPIPITKGVVKNVDAKALKNPDFATELRNLVIDESGANIDRPALSEDVFGQTGAAYGLIGAHYFPVSGTVVLVDENRSIWSMTSAGVTTNITGLALGGSGRPTFAEDGTYLAIACSRLVVASA